MNVTDEDVARTLAEYERLAQGSGEWDGREPVEFTDDGVSWGPFWAPTGDRTHPVAARCTVHRKGVAVPTTAYVRWEEALPAEDSWRDLWAAKPTTLFGAFTARQAIRSAFREAIGNRREPDDPPTGAPRGVVMRTPEEWFTRLRGARTVEALDEVWEASVGVRTGAFERLYRRLRSQIGGGMSEHAAMQDPIPNRHRVVPNGVEAAMMPLPGPPSSRVPTLESGKPISRKQAARHGNPRRKGGGS
tara:strand:- start:6175 stop:6912 length:738 start_codon:yes stop_codon:yes gene_type:complete